MSEIQEAVSTNQLSSTDVAGKTGALIAYGLMIIGIFTVIFWFVGAIWAMFKKGDAKGTLFEDHYSNIIKIFWWSLFLSIAGLVLTYTALIFNMMLMWTGSFIWACTFIWVIFRLVKGLAKITSNKAYCS